MFVDQYQFFSDPYIKQIVKSIIPRVHKRFKVEEAFKKIEEISNISVEDLNKSNAVLKNEVTKLKELEKARRKITKSTYRTFKETLCPVCCTFACPYHTPLENQDGDADSQTIKGFAYNPYILEENQKKIILK